MIYLESIRLTNLKGIKELYCDFEDITLLAGLNNSGKTTILQAIHLLTSALPVISTHQHMFNQDSSVRRISLSTALSTLGFQDVTTLFPQMKQEASSTIVGLFSGEFSVEIKPIATTQFEFNVTSVDNLGPEELRVLLQTMHCSSEFVTPPGTVSSREDMMSQGNYQAMLGQGKGSQLWRNAIWWSVQQEGYEAFEAVKTLVSRYFPEVEVLQPTLGVNNPPEILLNYKEHDGAKLDIAQSGAGLRTFLTLARLLQQSSANIFLLDEPDAHLHASQQAVVINLLMDTALEMRKQVIIASHSPEFIIRTPVECLRWVDQNNPEAHLEEMRILLEKLGVTPDVYLSGHKLPEVIVYVEGKTDKPVVESLISWCRQIQPELPSVKVVTHRDGRFDAPAITAISRVFKELGSRSRIIGIRDLDWYYNQMPSVEPERKIGDGWELLTLPYKELENLFCDADFLFQSYAEKVPKKAISEILDEESQNDGLVNEWGYQVKFKIREALPTKFDPSTKEQEADAVFNDWKSDAPTRIRLVAGKALLRRVRERIKNEFQISRYPQRMFEYVSTLPPVWDAIARSIFLDLEIGPPIKASSNTPATS